MHNIIIVFIYFSDSAYGFASGGMIAIIGRLMIRMWGDFQSKSHHSHVLVFRVVIDSIDSSN